MKKWGFRLVGFAFILTLTGCGGGSLVTIDRIGEADAPNTMTLQMNSGYTHQSSNESWGEGFEELFTEWAEEHPDWQIELEIIPDSQAPQQQTQLLEEARVGRAPDCASIDSFAMPRFIEQDALQPVDEYFDEEELEGQFPFVRNIVTGGDGEETYAYWWATDLRVLYRDTELVPEAPRTWDELIEAGLAAEEQNPDVDGYLFNGGRFEGTTFDNLAHFWSQGGELIDEDGNTVLGEGRNPEYMLNMLRFLEETVDSGVAPGRVATIGDYDEFVAAAQSDTVAMFQGGDFQHPDLQESLPPEEFENWEVSLLPTMEAGQEQTTGTGGWAIGALSDDPEKVETCMEFAKEIYAGPANEVTGQLPTSQDKFDELEGFDAPVYDTFREGLEFGKARPGFSSYSEISNQLQIAIGRVLSGETTPEQAVDRVINNAPE